MILRREETSELSAQVQRLVVRLMDRDQNVEETFNGLECRINRHHVMIDREETQVQSHLPQVFPITNHLVSVGIPFGVGLHPADPDLASRDRQDVVDLTLDSDSEEDSAMPVESVTKVPRPAVRDSDRSLIPIEEGHSVGKQCCIHSLGCIKRTGPYWTTVTGVRRGKGELQLLESGSCSDSARVSFFSRPAWSHPRYGHPSPSSLLTPCSCRHASLPVVLTQVVTQLWTLSKRVCALTPQFVWFTCRLGDSHNPPQLVWMM